MSQSRRRKWCLEFGPDVPGLTMTHAVCTLPPKHEGNHFDHEHGIEWSGLPLRSPPIPCYARPLPKKPRQ